MRMDHGRNILPFVITLIFFVNHIQIPFWLKNLNIYTKTLSLLFFLTLFLCTLFLLIGSGQFWRSSQAIRSLSQLPNLFFIQVASISQPLRLFQQSFFNSKILNWLFSIISSSSFMDITCYYPSKTINHIRIFRQSSFSYSNSVLGVRSVELGDPLSWCWFSSNTCLPFDLQACPPPPHIPSLARLLSTTPAVSDREPAGSVQRSRGQGHMFPVLSGPLPCNPMTSTTPWTLPLGLSGLHDILPRGIGPCFHLSVWGYLTSFLQPKHCWDHSAWVWISALSVTSCVASRQEASLSLKFSVCL